MHAWCVLTRSRGVGLIGTAVVMASIAGCGGTVEYFEEMELLPAKEKLIEHSLGHFGMPVPVKTPVEGTNWTHGNAIHLSFDLHAVVGPRDEKAIAKAWEQYEGNFRNDLLQLCRHASLDELTEPGLLTLKGRLTDMIGRYLGERRVRRLVFTKIKVMPR